MNAYYSKNNKHAKEHIGNTLDQYISYIYIVESATDGIDNRKTVKRDLLKSNTDNFVFNERNEICFRTLDDAIHNIKQVIDVLKGRWCFIKIAELLTEIKEVKQNNKIVNKKFYTRILKPEYNYNIQIYKK